MSENIYDNENVLRKEKRRKLHEMRKNGINPYPYKYDRTCSLEEIRKKFENIEPGEKKEDQIFKLCGRLMAQRTMGKATFLNIMDQYASIQVYIQNGELDELGQKSFDLIDIGDFVGISGFIFKTKKGELSLFAKSFEVLCKTLEPLPEKFHGISDPEIKYRYRHLDLIMDPQSRKVFETSSKIIREIRSYLDEAGFLEVETPTLQPIYGGAAAEPFQTHHRALDMTLYMKISPELYLKRLIVGGYEKVYDLGKNFRNEGVDRTHNPEFTMLEWYEAWTDYNDQMIRFEQLVERLALRITGSTKISYQGKEIELKAPWKRLTVYDGLREYAQIDPEKISDDELFTILKKYDEGMKEPLVRGKMLMNLFEFTVEPHLWQPTFVMDHPKEISPLTKVHRKNSNLVERFEPFCAGMEIGNAYSELNDPEDQLNRLLEQQKQRSKDKEAHPMDDNFIHAIDVGMPPTGGVGLGVGRIVMLLTDSTSIRDVILFPTMKQKN